MTSLALMARCVVGLILLRSGAVKLVMDPNERSAAVTRYALLPGRAVPWAAQALYLAELGLAGLLLAGVALRPIGIVSATLFAIFSCAVAINLGRQRVFDCGCGPQQRVISWRLVGQDLVLCSASALIAICPTRLFALWPGWGAPQTHPVAGELLPVPMLTLLLFVVSVVIVRSRQLRVMNMPAILETLSR